MGLSVRNTPIGTYIETPTSRYQVEENTMAQRNNNNIFIIMNIIKVRLLPKKAMDRTLRDRLTGIKLHSKNDH